tara:strand:+ start:1042 stop:1263 length:222 start_codon:yes stop_codon:yes gene_type:complete
MSVTKLNVTGGVPSNKEVKPNTIRMTVQVEVPYKNELMNYGYLCKQEVRDFINSDEFGGMLLEAGPAEGRNLD